MFMVKKSFDSYADECHVVHLKVVALPFGNYVLYRFQLFTDVERAYLDERGLQPLRRKPQPLAIHKTHLVLYAVRKHIEHVAVLERLGVGVEVFVFHQGFADGCADGAFFEETTGNIMITLNGGCSEARQGRLGLMNRDMLHYAFRKELPSW